MDNLIDSGGLQTDWFKSNVPFGPNVGIQSNERGHNRRRKMASGDDIQAGEITGAGGITDLVGEFNGDPDFTDFSGDVILRVGPNVSQGDMPQHTVDGIRAYAWSGTIGSPLGGGNGVTGVGGPGLPPKPGGIGVVGFGGPDGVGLFGVAQGNADGVVGRSDNNGKSGVFGFNDQKTGAAYGVSGWTNSPDGFGVNGFSDVGVGVRGYSTSKYGVSADGGMIGVVGRGGPIGVLGYSASGSGVYGLSDGGGLAGRFEGKVNVHGDFNVIAPGVKGALVPHPDGSHRQLYCMESPESWFEDFGEGKLIKGKARVQLDSGFASVVKTNTYHVFLTPYGDSNGLYVARRSKRGFEVKEQGNGKSSLSFSYRIVAKRKDVEGKRLAKVKVPKVPEIPKVSKVPRVPEIPKVPKIPPQSVVYSASKGHEAKTPRAKRPK
jgi:hypothetical protein